MLKNIISIIIPVYNGANTVGRCLETVFKSAYEPFECIVVDDNSNDGTVDIVRSFNVKLIKLDGHRGAAYARNMGAKAAKGDILLFIDADVTIYPDCLDNVARDFRENPDVSAIFGTYDDQPDGSNFLSQYKNLFHHYIHQTSGEDASTFWTACGAVRSEVFNEIGGFNNNCRMMEDVELGYRLKAGNHKILLDKKLNVTHLKRYSFLNLLKSDFFDRAIPWTVLMLRNKQHINDLNLKIRHKLSAVVVLLIIASALLAASSTWIIYALPVLLAMFLTMNIEFYKFYLRKRGAAFALKVIPLHFLYYIYSTLGFIIGHYRFHFNKKEA